MPTPAENFPTAEPWLAETDLERVYRAHRALHGHAASGLLILPPLGVLWLEPMVVS